MPLAILVIGILSCALAVFGWVFYIACFSVILAVIGLILYGIQAKHPVEGSRDKKLNAALVMCIVGLVINLVIVMVWVFTQAGLGLSPFPSPTPLLD